ncbi:NAD-dependent dihydropyrimidine dehydrogenase subunit PreA [bacterium]|nr:NAD-dependent dihydropyrimidine dehydrogenase subunit PreA [bacterium]
MPDLSVEFCGVKSPNPFWLASAPPTNSAYQVARAFDAGWGGVIWKTIGEPIVNVSSRYGAMDYMGSKVAGLNNIELISDRPIEVNFKEIYDIKQRYPNHVVFASLMVESKEETWQEMVKRTIDSGADGIELNFGCPHGMSERGMGSAVGQVPEYCQMITEWVVNAANKQLPVIVKLTPNVTDVRMPGRAAKAAGADGVALINTINSIMGIDLDTYAPKPCVDGLGSHGGYCGPAVKPIALHMVSQIATDPDCPDLISGIGGIQKWQDAVEHMLCGATTVQVATAAMHYGFRIVEQLASGMKNWMREKGFETPHDFIGLSSSKIREWKNLNLNHKVVAEIDQQKCINCGLCYIACEDGCHQSINKTHKPVSDLASNGYSDRVYKSGSRTGMAGAGADGIVNMYQINQETCVGCNMCSLVCPVEGCITMKQIDTGKEPMSWAQYQERLAAGTIEPIQPPEHV